LSRGLTDVTKKQRSEIISTGAPVKLGLIGTEELARMSEILKGKRVLAVLDCPAGTLSRAIAHFDNRSAAYDFARAHLLPPYRQGRCRSGKVMLLQSYDHTKQIEGRRLAARPQGTQSTARPQGQLSNAETAP
jgi:hypothetical protein